MAIKLSIYLKRTEQTLKGWMRNEGIDDPSKLAERAAFLGFSVGPDELREARSILVTPAAAAAPPAEVAQPAAVPEASNAEGIETPKPARTKRRGKAIDDASE